MLGDCHFLTYVVIGPKVIYIYLYICIHTHKYLYECVRTYACVCFVDGQTNSFQNRICCLPVITVDLMTYFSGLSLNKSVSFYSVYEYLFQWKTEKLSFFFSYIPSQFHKSVAIQHLNPSCYFPHCLLATLKKEKKKKKKKKQKQKKQTFWCQKIIYLPDRRKRVK